jgi:hypothetical protein
MRLRELKKYVEDLIAGGGGGGLNLGPWVDVDYTTPNWPASAIPLEIGPFSQPVEVLFAYTPVGVVAGGFQISNVEGDQLYADTYDSYDGTQQRQETLRAMIPANTPISFGFYGDMSGASLSYLKYRTLS